MATTEEERPHGVERRENEHDADGPDRRHADRREFPRIQVEVWVEEVKSDQLYYLRTADLSVGGAFLEGNIPYAPGARLSLKIPLPPHIHPFELEAEVVQAGDHRGALGMGVKFLNPTDAFAEAVAALGITEGL